jgi:hypothetical protein
VNLFVVAKKRIRKLDCDKVVTCGEEDGPVAKVVTPNPITKVEGSHQVLQILDLSSWVLAEMRSRFSLPRALLVS